MSSSTAVAANAAKEPKVSTVFRAALKVWLRRLRTVYALMGRVYEYDNVVVNGTRITKDDVRGYLSALIEFAKSELPKLVDKAGERKKRVSTNTGGSFRKAYQYNTELTNLFVNANLSVGNVNVSQLLMNNAYYMQGVANVSIFRSLFAIYAVQNGLFDKVTVSKNSKGVVTSTSRNMANIRLDQTLANLGLPATKSGKQMDPMNIQLYMYLSTIVNSYKVNDVEQTPELVASITLLADELKVLAKAAKDAYKASYSA